MVKVKAVFPVFPLPRILLPLPPCCLRNPDHVVSSDFKCHTESTNLLDKNNFASIYKVAYPESTSGLSLRASLLSRA